MIKSELIITLAEKQPHLQKDDVEAAVNCMLEQMADALSKGISIYTTFPKNCRAVAFKASSSSWE